MSFVDAKKLKCGDIVHYINGKNKPTTELVIIEVEQDPPGKLFEYPALKVLIDKCIQDNIPYLYIHTKGAANTTSVNGNVRKIWKHEFSTSRFNNYTKLLQSDIPLVICPWTGKLDELHGLIHGLLIQKLQLF